MSCSKWKYDPEVCDGQPCPGDCDKCCHVKLIQDMKDSATGKTAMEIIKEKSKLMEGVHAAPLPGGCKQSTYGTCMDGSQDEF